MAQWQANMTEFAARIWTCGNWDPLLVLRVISQSGHLRPHSYPRIRV